MSNDSKTTERDELLKLHAPLTRGAQEQPEYRDNTESALYGYSEGVEHALDTVWAKGYRKPRTITTVEELDALPDEALVRSDFGVIHEKRTEFDAGRVVWVCPGDSDEHTAGKIMLPATVLHEPEAEATR